MIGVTIYDKIQKFFSTSGDYASVTLGVHNIYRKNGCYDQMIRGGMRTGATRIEVSIYNGGSAAEKYNCEQILRLDYLEEDDDDDDDNSYNMENDESEENWNPNQTYGETSSKINSGRGVLRAMR